MKLLLAEDETSLSRAIKALLEKHNYTVNTVDDGQQALLYLDHGDYDALILDIMMPKMDGITVLQTIRANHNPIPVLILSAKSEVEDKVNGLDQGANDYLTKPFSTEELLARIRALTRTPFPNQLTHLFQFGNITLDQSTYELKNAHGCFHLANKEYQMMETLIAHPGRVISTSQFMEHIWGLDSETEINVVWVYISYLRKKLLALNANVRIKGIRNVGYTLEIIE